MIFGKTEQFAIEIAEPADNISKSLLPIRIWLNSIPIGTFFDKTYIPVFLGRLERCLSGDLQLPIEWAKQDTQEKFDNLMQGDDSAKYVLGLGDSFDDYNLFYYHKDNLIFFIWSLCNSPNFHHKNELIGSSFECSSEKDFISSVLNEFKHHIET